MDLAALPCPLHQLDPFMTMMYTLECHHKFDNYMLDLGAP